MTRQPMTPEHKAAMKAGRLRAASVNGDTAKSTHKGGLFASSLPPSVVKRLADIPERYKPQYLRALRGKSMRAAINAQCAECMGWEGCPEAIEKCTSPACPLYAYRPGR